MIDDVSSNGGEKKESPPDVMKLFDMIHIVHKCKCIFFLPVRKLQVISEENEKKKDTLL